MPIQAQVSPCNDEKLARRWRGVTFADALNSWAESYASEIALVDGDERVEYAELRRRSHAMASAFLDLGIKARDVALLRMGNTQGFIYALFGLFEIGAIPIMLRAANKVSEVVTLGNQGGAVALVTLDGPDASEARSLAQAVLEGCPGVRSVLCESDMPAIWADPTRTLEGRDYERPGLDDISHLLLSGGSTGVPKLVPHTHRMAMSIAAHFGDVEGLGPSDKSLVVLPAPFNFALLADIFPTFMSGGTVVMCPDPSPVEICDLVAREHVTHMALVPTLAQMCIAYREACDLDDLSSLRLVVEGGMKPSRQVMQQTVEVLGCRVMQCFGTVEGFILCSRLDDDLETILDGYVTSIIPQDVFKVTDEAGVELPCGELGEFRYDGPYKFAGYYGNPEATARAFDDEGFYRSGDLALITAEGRVCVHGRVKEQINRAGCSVMPEAVEQDLRCLSEVVDCCVLGIPDDVMGERICACVIPADGCTCDQQDLVARLRDAGASEHHLPDVVMFMEAFPQTAASKIDKLALRELVMGERGADDAASVMRQGGDLR